MKDPFKASNTTTFSELKQSAGILDDYAIRKNIATKEGTITKVPVNNYDIVNKAYIDAAFVPYTGAVTDLNLGTHELIFLNSGVSRTRQMVTSYYGNDTFEIYPESLIFFIAVDPAGTCTTSIGDTNGYVSGARVQIHGDIFFTGILNNNGNTGVTGSYGGTAITAITVSGGIVTSVSGF